MGGTRWCVTSSMVTPKGHCSENYNRAYTVETKSKKCATYLAY